MPDPQTNPQTSQNPQNPQDSQTTNTPPALPPELTSHLVQVNGQWGLKTIVDGQEGFVPLDLAKASAQKWQAADKRLAEAAALAREHKSAIQYYQDTLAGLNGDADAARRALEFVGVDTSDMHTNPQRSGRSDQTSQPTAVDPAIARAAKVIQDVEKTYGINFADALGLTINQARSTVDQSITNEAVTAAMSDPILGNLLKNEKTAKHIVAELRGQVRSQIAGGAEHGPQTYLPVIHEIAAKYKDMGIQGTPKETAESVLNRHGLGPASMAGFADSTGVALDKRPQPVSPVKAKPGEYAKNLMARLAYDLAHRGQGELEVGT